MTLALAMIVDALLGEPRWLWDRYPHPAVMIGRAIGWADTRWNQGDHRRARGIALVFALVIGSVVIGWLITKLGPLTEIAAIAILLAQRSLVQHVAAVAQALRLSTGSGRAAVAMIVGRDTAGLDDPAIARAAIESGAENLSDGVIAPIFWTLIAGVPGLLAYKAINTADSMIGYRTPRHQAFGWAAARLDDLINLIPARLTAMLIIAATADRPDWAKLRAEARLHRSPNAGWPEAAMAHTLNIALSGPRTYDGTKQAFPWVNATGDRNPGAADIDSAVHVLWRAWALALAFVITAALITAFLCALR